MDGGVAQKICNLGEIHLAVADELLCRIYFHQVEAFHYTAAPVFPEQLFKLRDADQIVPADLPHGQLAGDVSVQIGQNIAENCVMIGGWRAGEFSVLNL